MKFRADDAGPNEPVPDCSALVEAVLVLLEGAGVPASVNDRIVEILEEWESRK